MNRFCGRVPKALNEPQYRRVPYQKSAIDCTLDKFKYGCRIELGHLKISLEDANGVGRSTSLRVCNLWNWHGRADMPCGNLESEEGMNDALLSRLVNWKFQSAKGCLEGEPQQVKDVVEALSRSFGNCGWFDGDLGTVVGFVVDKLKEEHDATRTSRVVD